MLYNFLIVFITWRVLQENRDLWTEGLLNWLVKPQENIILAPIIEVKFES